MPVRLNNICTAAPRVGFKSKRLLHHRIIAPPPPPPTPFVPDVATFLQLIGRKWSAHASKFSSWDQLFNLTSPQLAKLGVENARQRRYLLHWRNRFRARAWGLGGDLKHVTDGVAKVKLCNVPIPKPQESEATTPSSAAIENDAEADIPPELTTEAVILPEIQTPRRLMPATMTSTPGFRKIILNLPEELIQKTDSEALADFVRNEKAQAVSGLKIQDASRIVGPYVDIERGSQGKIGLIKVREGLWEHRRGVKVDGGERRKDEVRAKRRSAERKAAKS